MAHRFYPISRLVLATLLSVASCASAGAQDIYKWTDANGKVHYGDRAAAPAGSTAVAVKLPPPSPPPAVPASSAGARPRPVSHPHRDPGEDAVRVDPARVAPACQGLIEKIQAVPPGNNWESLYRQYDAACPRIAYECVEFRSRPKDKMCYWVERSGSRVLHTKQYP